jgi:photosystem II stability/assembly factor-like uncharacterized protein
MRSSAVTQGETMFRNICSFIISGSVALLLGTIPSLAGDNVWTTDGPTGVRIKSIAINPLDHYNIYIGTVDDRLYRSTDAGQTWCHLSQADMAVDIIAIAIHPFGPDTIYVGTDAGMYKSTDAGDNWQMLYPPQGVRNDYRAIVINPAYPNIIIAGGASNEWKSTDSGQTWEEMPIDPNQGWDVGIQSIVVDRQNPNRYYLATNSSPYGKGAYRSLDMGESWQRIQNNIDSCGAGWVIAIDPSDGNTIYYGRYDYLQVNCDKCVSKSTNGGDSWIDITPDSLTNSTINDIKVSPTDPNTIYVCTIFDGLLKSPDGGRTWERKNNGLHSSNAYRIAIDSITGNIFLSMIDDGLYKSINGGDSWELISQNIYNAYSYNLAVVSDTPPHLFATCPNGFFESINDGQSWDRLDIGIPPYNILYGLLTDWRLPGYIFVGSCRASIHSTGPPGIYISSDDGNTWSFHNNGLNPNDCYRFMAASIVSSQDVRLFAVGEADIYKSDDLGENWSLCFEGNPSDYYSYRIKVSPASPNIIAVGNDDGHILVSFDRGGTWSLPAPFPGTPARGFEDLQFHPLDSLTFYVANDVGIFETTDGGQSWANIIDDIPHDELAVGVSAPLINPDNPDNMFVASFSYGVFQTHDGGANWESFSEGFDPIFWGGWLQFAPNDTTRLYLNAPWRSVWSIHRTLVGVEDNAPVLPDKILLSNYPNPFNASTKISFVLPKEEHFTLNLYDITGRKIATISEATYPAGSHSLNLSLKDHASGIYYLVLDTDDAHITRKMVMIK